MKKTIFLIFVLILIVVLFGSTISMAADYPAKLITLINPWSAGGGTDVVARTLAEELKSILGVNVIVVNKTGGSGAIVIRNDAPWKTPQEFIDDAKARPGEITIGVSGIGGMSHLNAENFKIASGADIKIVSFEGAAKSVAALAGKHIDAMSAQLGEAKGFVDAGEFRWLAVGDDKRHPAYPDTPTFKESGVDFQLNQYRAIWAPKNTPMDRVKIIANAVEKAMKTESMEKILENTLCQNYFMSSEELTKELEKQDVILKNLVKDSGLLK